MSQKSLYVKSLQSPCQEQRDEEHGAENELVHHYHRRLVGLRQRLRERYLAHFARHCNKEDQYSPIEQRPGLRPRVRHEEKSGEGHEDTYYITCSEPFAEYEQPHHHREQRIRRYYQRGDRRGIGEFEAVGLRHEIDERHTQRQQQELDPVLAADTHVVVADFVKDKQQEAL